MSIFIESCSALFVLRLIAINFEVWNIQNPIYSV